MNDRDDVWISARKYIPEIMAIGSAALIRTYVEMDDANPYGLL